MCTDGGDGRAGGGAGSLALCLPLSSSGVAASEAEDRLAHIVLEDSAVVFVGVRADDAVFGDKTERWFADALKRKCVLLPAFSAAATEVSVVNALMGEALSSSAHRCDYFALWSDAISRASTSCFAPAVAAAFDELARADGGAAPAGLGCVMLPDAARPGCAVHPVVHRRHFDAFGKFCPFEEEVVSDIGRWVYETYRRASLAAFLPDFFVSTVEAEEEDCARHWKNAAPCVLDAAVERLRAYAPGMRRTRTLDVVTPTFRGNLELLRRIAALRVPEGFSTHFCMVVDDPEMPKATKEELRGMVHKHAPYLRVRYNKTNLGASGSRNGGVAASAAEWVLFLDDDVDVPDTLLHAYARRVLEDETAAGFVGKTTFPPPRTLMQHGTHLSDITYFWDIADKMDDIAWGVTANVMLRRTAARFDLAFIKTGGGEDISFCIDTVALTDKLLRPAPEAHALHPWWSDCKTTGDINPVRFLRWTQGDGLLFDKYPQFTYRSPPNIQEVCFGCAVGGAAAALSGRFEAAKGAALCAAWALFAEAVDEAVRLALPGRVNPLSPSGFVKTAYAFYVRKHVDVGNLWVHIKRGKLHHLCKRFDYFCGRKSLLVDTTLRFAKFASFVAAPLISTTSVAADNPAVAAAASFAPIALVATLRALWKEY